MLRGTHNAERHPQSVPELILGATGATGGCVKFLPAVYFFSRNNAINSELEVDKFIDQSKDLCCLEANLMMS